MSKTIPFKTMTDEWKKNPDYQKEYESLQPDFEVARELIHGRAQ